MTITKMMLVITWPGRVSRPTTPISLGTIITFMARHR